MFTSLEVDDMHRNHKKQHVDSNKIKPIEVKDFKPTVNSSHDVSTYEKEKKGKSEPSKNAWVVKHLKKEENPALSEIEGAAGDFYRLLIGSRQPKVRTIIERSGYDLPTGVMSKLVDKYKTIREQSIDLTNTNQIRQLAEIFVVAGFLEEADLSDENLGFNAQNELVKMTMAKFVVNCKASSYARKRLCS